MNLLDLVVRLKEEPCDELFLFYPQGKKQPFWLLPMMEGGMYGKRGRSFSNKSHKVWKARPCSVFKF